MRKMLSILLKTLFLMSRNLLKNLQKELMYLENP